MMRQWWACVVILGCFAAWLFAAPGVVITQDGRRYQGEVTDDPDQETVSVSIRGIETIIDRRDIQSIEYPQNAEQQFRDRLAKLEPGDYQGRIDLARWAFDNKHYDLAREALGSALQIDPNSAEAIDFLATVRRQIRLERAASSQPATTGPSTSTTQTAENVPPVERKFLTTADINIIRQKELKPVDSGVRIRFANDVERRFISAANKNPGNFNALNSVDRALMILKEGDPQLHQDVKILSDPPAMQEYRLRIQPMILAGCASAGCHGGPAGGDLILFTGEGEAATYTNFYILHNFAKEVQGVGGAFGQGAVQRRLIERTHSQDSLLAQYGLSPEIAEIDHPPTIGEYRGIFPNRQDPAYRRLVDWMGKTLYPVRPNYNITFDPPRAPATTQPITQPTQPDEASSS